MRVTKIETSKFWANWVNWLFVRVETDEGLTGWGEASLHGPIGSVETAIAELGAHLIGEDPSGPERHWHRLYNAWRWRGGAVLQTALAGIDIALWDLEGKRLGVPVYRLLGGPHRTRLPVYASHWLQGVTTAEAAFESAAEAVRRGFRGFKWNPFSFEALRQNEARTIAHAAELMAAAREGAGPDIEIFIECGELLSPRTAVLAAEAFKPYRPGWFEEPIPFENAKAMARLQREMAVPIATGERLLSRFEFREILDEGACKIIQPDIMHGGGFTELRRIAALADMHYVPVAPHNPGGPVCTMASMHLAAAIPNFLILEEIEPDRALRDSASNPAIAFEDGHFVLPDTPGLGLEPNLEALRDYPARPQPRYERAGSLYR